MALKSFRLCHWVPLLLLSEAALPGVLPGMAAWAHDAGAAGFAASADRADSVTLDSSAPSAAASDSAAPAMELVLAVTLNGQPAGLAQFHMADGALWATRDTLRQIGLLLPPGADAMVRLDTLRGVTVRYDEEEQALSLMVPPAMLDAGLAHIGVESETNPAATSSTGLLLDYDAYANFVGGSATFNGFTEARAFSGNSVVDTTALFTLGGGHNAGTRRAVRLDSAWSTSFPDKLLTLRVGDTVTAATDWSRATRIGGVQLGTNFALQPYLVTAPLPSFVGSATLPSKVDLYIDGVRRYSGEVPAGPFSLNAGANQINGAGRAQVVLTDMLGQVSTLAFSLYNTPRLLGKGISDWSVEAGAVRRNYGLASFDYAHDPVVSATWRRGLSDHVTAEAHGEAGPSVVDLGFGGAWLLGASGGVVSASLAGSRAQGRDGYQWSFGYSWSDSRFNFQAETLRASRSYRDIASRWSLPPPRARDYAQMGYATRGIGSVGLNYLHERYAGQPSYRYAGLYWSRPVGRRFSLNLSVNQNLEDRHDRAVFLTLSFSPTARDYFSAGYAHQRGADSETLSAQRSVPQSGGLGWRVDARQDDDRTAGAAQLDYLTSAGEAHAGISAGAGPTAGYLGYSGSLVLMADRLFVARHIDDSFAVVSTGGVADVPVTLENSPVGRTGADGLLLVPRLNAYQRNMLAIDPADLPVTTRVDQVAQPAVPTDRSGVMVRFPIATFGALTMTLVDGTGQLLPEGSAAHIAGRGGDPLIVGFDGQLYVENPPPNGALSIDLPAGACRASLPATPPTNRIVSLGTVRCLPESAP